MGTGDSRRQIRAGGHAGSNASINRELAVLRAAFKFVERGGYAVDVPPVKLLPEPAPREKVISAAECRQLLAACETPHLRLFVKMCLFTLQRHSAILTLRVEQVDLVRNRIDFNRPGQPQTYKRRPVVPISKELWRDLAEAVRDSQTGYIIEYKGQPLRSVRTAFRAAARRANMKDGSPTVLRHTGATLLAGAGVSMRQIAGVMGHSQVHATERYAKHSPDYLQSAVTALEELLGG